MRASVGLLAVMVLWLCGCRQQRHEPAMAAYYWSTVFDLDSAQHAFLHDQHIRRIYLRYFDVALSGGRALPNATVQVRTGRPDSTEVVPVVFIVNDCLKSPQPLLDSLIFGRVMRMSETHRLGPIHEIQIDCDWTRSTQRQYFEVLRRLHERTHAHGITLSATIRLHQLSQAPPPADRGVLMMYNTGDVTQRDGPDPILDMSQVRPYLPRLSSYALPLATAYPIFEWRVAFRGQRFIGIVHADEYLPLLPGDTIITRQGTADMVRRALQAVDSLRPDANDERIIYDMSKQNVKRFYEHHYENIF